VAQGTIVGGSTTVAQHTVGGGDLSDGGVHAGGRARGLLWTRARCLVKVALKRQVPPRTGGFAIIDTDILDLNLHFNIIINLDAGN
jgi:hypothetical protein